MNKVFLKGNVGKDPTIKRFENGGMIAQFTLATTERGFTTRDGQEIPEQTEWHSVLVRRTGLAEVCEKYVKKGSPLLIVGKVKTRSYEDNAGQTRYVTEIHVDEMELLGTKREAAPAPEPEYAPASKAAPAPGVSEDGHADDLPF